MRDLHLFNAGVNKVVTIFGSLKTLNISLKRNRTDITLRDTTHVMTGDQERASVCLWCTHTHARTHTHTQRVSYTHHHRQVRTEPQTHNNTKIYAQPHTKRLQVPNG